MSLIYKFINVGKKISLIFSDENMNCLNGTKSCELIKEILAKKRLEDIPFYLLTACDGSMMNKNSIFKGNTSVTEICEKPLAKCVALELLKKLKI